MKKLISAAILPLALFCGIASASAPVTGVVTFVNPDKGLPGGTFKYLTTPPAKVGNNNINRNDKVFAFSEKQSTLFGDAPDVDLGGPIASNTLVSSYYVYFDPNISQRIKATLTFSETILGIYIYTGTKDTSPGGVFQSGTGLKGSQDNFGLPTTTVKYRYAAGTGLEHADAAKTSFSGNVLTLNWKASNPGDHIRVLTAVTAVPEPESYALLLAGLGVVGAVARRRKAKQG